MALKTILLSQAFKIVKDEEKRNKLIILIVVILSLFLVIIFLPRFYIHLKH